MEIKRGEVYWVEIPESQTVGSEQWKRRPYIIVSRTAVNRLGHNVVGVPLSTKTGKASQHRILLPANEIIKDPGCSDAIMESVALTDQIRVLDVKRLEQPKIEHLSRTGVAAVELGLAFLFDIR